MPASPIPARDLLLRAAREMAQCRRLVGEIETAIAPLIAARAVGGAAPQAVDLLDQTLDDLATCLASVALGLPDGTALAPGPVLAGLRLDDLRRRLADQGEGPVGPGPAVALF